MSEVSRQAIDAASNAVVKGYGMLLLMAAVILAVLIGAYFLFDRQIQMQEKTLGLIFAEIVSEQKRVADKLDAVADGVSAVGNRQQSIGEIIGLILGERFGDIAAVQKLRKRGKMVSPYGQPQPFPGGARARAKPDLQRRN